MKTRHGFVSNSSSSSFILPIKSSEDTIKIEIPVSELKSLIKDDEGESSVDYVLKSRKEIDNYLPIYLS